MSSWMFSSYFLGWDMFGGQLLDYASGVMGDAYSASQILSNTVSNLSYAVDVNAMTAAGRMCFGC